MTAIDPHVSHTQNKQIFSPKSQQKTAAKPRFAYRFLKQQIIQYLNKSTHQILCFSLWDKAKQGELSKIFLLRHPKSEMLQNLPEPYPLWVLRRKSDPWSLMKGWKHLTAAKISDTEE